MFIRIHKLVKIYYVLLMMYQIQDYIFMFDVHSDHSLTSSQTFIFVKGYNMHFKLIWIVVEHWWES